MCLCRFLRNIQLTAQALPARVFADLGSLVMLGLPENQLSYLRADWWAPAGVSTLQVLDLHQNVIALLEPGVFDGLAPSLVSLDLHSNSLVVLPEQLFNVSFPVLSTWLVAFVFPIAVFYLFLWFFHPCLIFQRLAVQQNEDSALRLVLAAPFLGPHVSFCGSFLASFCF